MTVLTESIWLDASPPRLSEYAKPIDLIAQEHARFRACCEMLRRLADDPDGDDAADMAAAILTYVETALPLHVADEEADLFPMLRRACRPGDDIGYVLELLSMEHDDDIEYCRTLIEPLGRIADGGAPADPVRFSHYARAFALLQRRHLDWENVLVLPLARKRLSERDLRELGRRMAARRSVERGR